MNVLFAHVQRHGWIAPGRADLLLGAAVGVVTIPGQLLSVETVGGASLSLAPALWMMAEVARGWRTSVTSFAVAAAGIALWKVADPPAVLLSVAISMIAGLLIRRGARPAMAAAVLFVFTLLGEAVLHGSPVIPTSQVMAGGLIAAGINVALATTFLTLIPRRSTWLLPQRRARMDDLLFVVGIGSFSAAVLVFDQWTDDAASRVIVLGLALYLAIVLVALRCERLVGSLAQQLRAGRSIALAQGRGARHARVPREAARLFFMSLRENDRLRRLTVMQQLRLKSARRRVERLEEAVTIAERSARETKAARAKAVSLATAIDARWRAFLDSIPEAVILTDRSGVIQYANGSVRTLLAYSPEDLSGKPLSSLIPAGFSGAHPLHATTSLPRESVTTLQDASGKTLEQAAVRVHEFVATEKIYRAIQIRDLNPLQQLMSSTDLSGATREWSPDQFIATMSHEIRTPLHGLLATLDMLRSEPLSTEGARRLGIARTSAKTLLNIANDILDLSRIEADAITLERKPFSLKNVVEEAADEARARADSQGIELDTHVTGRLPTSVLGDAARIKQILRNLLSNALKFTLAGNVTVHAHYDAENGRCTIDVKDTGEGVPEDKRESIFQPFVQAESASSRRFGGAGLGLPISRRLSEAMGGSLVLLRTGPSGSTFRLTLELTASDEPPVEDQSQRILRLVQGRILVVEDDPASQYVAQTLIESLRCPVIVAGSGTEALDRLQKEEFDLVFVDCEMPGLDGYETAKRARSLLPERIAVIGMTASTSADDRRRCMEAGMDDVLGKPFTRSALNEMLCKWLSAETAAAGEGTLAARVSELSVLDTGVFDELWESLKWRMPAMRKIYESFVSVATETLSLLAQLQVSGNVSDTGRRLHSLLGSAGLVGARQVEYLAAWLGDAVKERRTEDVERALAHLRRAMSRFQQELDHRFNVLEGRG